MNELRFSAASLTKCTGEIVSAMGATPPIACEVSRHLVGANLAGQDGHGILRLPQYARQVECGDILPGNEPRVLHETAATAVVDARRGFGHYAGHVAVEMVARKARASGIGAVAIRHCTHVGRLGDFVERCDALGLVLLMTVGMAGRGVGGVVAHGGRERFLGANVWAVGVPGAKDAMVFDASMASIAVGKLYAAKANGRLLPDGCVIDRDGIPSNDPVAYLAGGAVLPLGGELGGHKGFGLGLAAALLGGLAMIGDDTPTLAGAPVVADAPPVGRLAGVMLLAIDPDAFGGLARYRTMVDACLDALRAAPPARGGNGIHVPGDGSRRTRREREQRGIPLARQTVEELASLAGGLRVDFPTAVGF
jgi:LDH2 family malate/lactate/ureidoglycolate dehydrogenase